MGERGGGQRGDRPALRCGRGHRASLAPPLRRNGVEGVGAIAKGRGRKSWLPEGTVAEVVRATLEDSPDDTSTHWTTRTLADRFGIGKGTVARIWRDHHLKPWKVDTFKLSNDPDFEKKLVDVVGLYMDPPERAAVFCFDEKTQCQALDRTQPSLPMRPGRAGTMTHDYKRNGTTDLFAAMNVATGEVLYDCRKRHTGKDVLAFFKLIDLYVPNDLEVHVVLDSLSAHMGPEVTRWLDHPKRRRWHLHFTPTSSSWLNLVERWFKEITDRRIRRGVFSSVAQLIEAIEIWTEHWNDDPKPFVWHKPAEEIMEKVHRGRATLHQIKSRRSTRSGTSSTVGAPAPLKMRPTAWRSRRTGESVGTSIEDGTHENANPPRQPLVGEGGLEPPRPCGHRNLNPARLPIPPLARASVGAQGTGSSPRGSPPSDRAPWVRYGRPWDSSSSSDGSSASSRGCSPRPSAVASNRSSSAGV